MAGCDGECGDSGKNESRCWPHGLGGIRAPCVGALPVR